MLTLKPTSRISSFWTWLVGLNIIATLAITWRANWHSNTSWLIYFLSVDPLVTVSGRLPCNNDIGVQSLVDSSEAEVALHQQHKVFSVTNIRLPKCLGCLRLNLKNL